MAILALLGAITGFSTEAFLPAGRAPLLLCAGMPRLHATWVAAGGWVLAGAAIVIAAASGAAVIYADHRCLAAEVHHDTTTP